MAELESRCEALGESQRNSLTEQLNRMAAENLGLRDTNDELSAEVESLRGQLAVAVRCTALTSSLINLPFRLMGLVC